MQRVQRSVFENDVTYLSQANDAAERKKALVSRGCSASDARAENFELPTKKKFFHARDWETLVDTNAKRSHGESSD